MAEFCKDCFIETFRPSTDEISRIVMTKECDLCEGCGNWKPVVSHIRHKPLLTTFNYAKECKKK